MKHRQAGILLHPTSLPGRFGIGDLGPEAEAFLDWLASAGQTLWQVLPLGPTGFGGSPYMSLSAFAGNPLLISPELLRQDGLLKRADLERAPRLAADRVSFDAAERWKAVVLRHAWERFRSKASPQLAESHRVFLDSPEHHEWLPGWAMFAALKERYRGAEWKLWDSSVRRREPAALLEVAHELREEIEFHAFAQFLFYRQWDRLREAARERGVEIFGDIPIYLPMESADVWENPHLFQLDEDLNPAAVSGVPPDYFSETGQHWGTPLYDWPSHEADGFDWWIRRVRLELRRVDLLRLDHFRGFQAYWSIPAGATDARGGRWEPGPDIRIFRALEGALGPPPLVAEDLGDITDEVRGLRDVLGLPGMRVLQFGLGHPESEHHPSRVPEHSVAYTGTHDNDTARGWFEGLSPEERERARADLPADEEEVSWSVVRAAFETRAGRAIAPMQDVLGLGSEARMNTPAVARGNWRWRMAGGQPTPETASRLDALTRSSGRASPTRSPI
ncbi:MAG TPA: 4-alpha-glucanotransferase [Candidatus Eisenbacteria bacterium]|nr:4-alpha-glucanotransferase [Candidatus Eisenbacteria bacterium]